MSTPDTTPQPVPTITAINGPANELNTGAPDPDTCLPMGQMSRSLVPCDPITGQIIWPDNSVIQTPVATVGIDRTLPVTGRDVAPFVSTASIALVVGVALVSLRKRAGVQR